MGKGRVNEGDEGEGIWLMGFIYIHEIENETSCNCFKWEWGGSYRGWGRGWMLLGIDTMNSPYKMNTC
jgi:hypothetical protein